jgi:hypothetical protein
LTLVDLYQKLDKSQERRGYRLFIAGEAMQPGPGTAAAH